MSLSYVALCLPLIYLALQVECLTRLVGAWRQRAYLPVGILLTGFLFQVYLQPAAPEVAARLPVICLGVAIAYLGGLLYLWRLSFTSDEHDTVEEFPVRENVLSLDAYRDLAQSRA